MSIKRQKLISFCDKLFLFFLFINPIFDLINGLHVYLLNSPEGGLVGDHTIFNFPALSIPLAVRMLFFAVMIVYLLMMRDKRALFAGAAIVLSFALTVGYEFLRGAEFSLKEDVLYTARFSYNLAAFLSYAHVLANSGKSTEELLQRVRQIICITLYIVSLGVLIPYVLNFGFYTYADRHGLRGCRGLFYAGNDVVAMMMLLLPLSLHAYFSGETLRSRGTRLQLSAAALCTLTLLIVGSKAAYLTAIASVAFFVLYALVRLIKDRDAKALLYLLVFICSVAVLFGLLSLLVNLRASLQIGGRHLSVRETMEETAGATAGYIETDGVETALFSGRTGMIALGWEQVSAALPLSALFGIGRGSQVHVIEMDVLEVFFYYGLVGAFAFLWIYCKHGFLFLRDLVRKPSFRALSTLCAMVICVGYLFLAGHVLFSVTAGFYFALTLLYARTLCFEGGLKQKLP